MSNKALDTFINPKAVIVIAITPKNNPIINKIKLPSFFNALNPIVITIGAINNKGKAIAKRLNALNNEGLFSFKRIIIYSISNITIF